MKFIGSAIFLTVLVITQLSAQETQVPISDEYRIMTITPELRNDLKLFPEISGFQDAKLYQLIDSSYVLEIISTQQGRIVKKRNMMTLTDVQSLRSRIHGIIKQTTPLGFIDQTGRAAFINTVIGLSVSYYGWSIPFLFQDIDSKAFVALYLMTASGMILYTTSATQHMELSKETAMGFQYGAIRGIVHGNALYGIFAGEYTRWFIPVSSVVSALEGAMVMSWVRENHTPLGNIYTVGAFSDFGTAMGVGGAFLLRKGDEFTLNEKDLRLLGSMLLAGSGVGYLIGKTIIDNTSYSSGDADILQSAGFLGAADAFSIADLAGTENRKALVSATMAGAVVGLGIGHALTRLNDFTDDQGTSIRLYTSLGMILGLGTAYSISGSESDRTIYLSMSTLGATIGFALAYNSANSVQSFSSTSHAWNMRLDPFGLQQKLFVEQGKEIIRYTPAIKLEYHF